MVFRNKDNYGPQTLIQLISWLLSLESRTAPDITAALRDTQVAIWRIAPTVFWVTITTRYVFTSGSVLPS